MKKTSSCYKRDEKEGRESKAIQLVKPSKFDGQLNVEGEGEEMFL